MNTGEKTLESMGEAVWYNRWTLDKFRKFLKGDILEIGCGIGNFTKLIDKYGNLWAIDIEKEYTKQTRDLVGKKVKLGLGDIEKNNYFFTNLKFDSIVCLNVLEHIRDDRKALRNLYKLLKKDGYLILLVPSHIFLYGKIDSSIGHFRRYSEKSLLVEMENIGFKIIKSHKLNFIGAIGWFISGRIFKKTIVENNKIKLFNLVAPFFLSLEKIIKPPVGISILIIAQRKT